MPDLTKVSGVANADIDKIDGVAAADISKVSGVTKPSAVTTATRWIIAGDAGKLFHTTTADGSGGWEELVDLGANAHKSVAYGKDNEGNARWVVQAATNAEEINYASASADISNSSNWTTVNFPTNYIGTDGGPGVAWGNDVWISTGKRIHDGDSYRTIMRSTDGAVTWTSVDHGSSINDNLTVWHMMVTAYGLWDSNLTYGHRQMMERPGRIVALWKVQGTQMEYVLMEMINGCACYLIPIYIIAQMIGQTIQRVR